jgi:NAD(P)-dependent dehydrogenase (short-subunit alcohol dehydrogenase family)
MRLSLAAVTTASAAAAVVAYQRRRPDDDLAGEVALVTGASRGLGLLIAAELARRGCRLLLCARDGAEAAAQIRLLEEPPACAAGGGTRESGPQACLARCRRVAPGGGQAAARPGQGRDARQDDQARRAVIACAR